ncbi:MAG: hypothetical protein QMD36_01280 [Candidatus Aenigmarchaeota archaeon]|nr:hypothetical protein [Candidatus Aenigmarchaeota archaeon]
MRELPNWVILLIILLICLVFVILIMFGIPQKAVEKLKIWVRVIWGTIA